MCVELREIIAYHPDKVTKRDRKESSLPHHTPNTIQHNMKAGAWVPSLENWGSGLKSFFTASQHVYDYAILVLSVPSLHRSHLNERGSLYSMYIPSISPGW